MSEETVGAASSAAEEDVFGGQQPTLAEYNQYRKGELPARFRPAEKAESDPADAPEETVEEPEGEDPEPAPDSDPEDKQEPKLPPKTSEYEKRVKQLLAEKKELARKLAAKQDAKPESSPALPVQQADKEPTAEDQNPDGTPRFKTYEEFTKALARWEIRQELAEQRKAEQQEAGAKALNAKVEEGRTRYENLDAVIVPAANEIYNDPAISPVIKQMIGDSDVMVDLMYTIANDPAEYAKFVKMAKEAPGKAIRYIALTESFITEELAGKAKVEEETPAKPKTNAPKPPSPVGGTSSRAFDVSDESLSPEEWARKRTKQLQMKN